MPDPDDEHVVAAAVVARAGVIVTENLRHFPVARLPNGLQALTAVQFAYSTVGVDPGLAVRAIAEISRRSGHQDPRLTIPEIPDRLDTTYGMHDSTALQRPHLH
jgi:hypothetical protein